MQFFAWKRRLADRDLSAFLDGELDDDRVAKVGERLVFDRDYRRRCDDFAAASALSDAVTAPSQIPCSSEFAARLKVSLSADPAEPAVRAARRRLNPALIASLGILITAGVTFAGMRRRGLV